MELKRHPAANVWQGQEASRATVDLNARCDTFAGRSTQGSRVRRNTQDPPVPCDLPAGWAVQGGVEFDCNPGDLSSLPHVGQLKTYKRFSANLD